MSPVSKSSLSASGFYLLLLYSNFVIPFCVGCFGSSSFVKMLRHFLYSVSASSSAVAVPVGVAVVSVFGLVFTASAFTWICCQRKSAKSQKTPPYKFVHMLKGVDIYPESLSGKKKFAATAAAAGDVGKTDINGNCHAASLMSAASGGKLASSPSDARPALQLDLEKRDLNGNFTTKPFHHHQQQQQTVRSSPDLELPSPHAGFTQPGAVDRRDLPSPSSGFSSQAPTPAVDKPLREEEKEGGVGTLHFSLEYQPERKAFIVHIKVSVLPRSLK